MSEERGLREREMQRQTDAYRERIMLKGITASDAH